MDEPHEDPSPDDDARERSLVDDLRLLAEDARRLADAEVAYQKSRASFAGQELRSIVVLVLLAGSMVFIALMALTFGLVLALTPLLTAWGATGVVVSGLVVGTLLCGTWARVLWRRMRQGLAGQERKP